MSGSIEVPTTNTTCIPGYIVLQRSATGTYTTYTFDSLPALGKWAIDAMMTGGAPASAPAPVPVPVPAPVPVPVALAPPTTVSPSSTDIDAAVTTILTSGLRKDEDVGDTEDDTIVLLTEKQTKLLADCICESPALYIDELFTLPTGSDCKRFYSMPEFSAELSKRKDELVLRLTQEPGVHVPNVTIRVFVTLYNYLFIGLHNMSWDSCWSKVEFNGVGAWERKNVDAMVKACMTEWLSNEKPSDAIRDFFLKTFMVRNYHNNPTSETGSSDFLSSFTTSLTRAPHNGLPKVFTEWLVKGTTFSHCKAALSALGVQQIRRSTGQFYKGLLLAKGLTGVNVIDDCGTDHLISLVSFDDKLTDTDESAGLAEFEKAGAVTDKTNLLLTSDFTKRLEDAKDPLAVYKELRDTLHVEYLSKTGEKLPDISAAMLRWKEKKVTSAAAFKSEPCLTAQEKIWIPEEEETLIHHVA